jgi:rhodanese-related sulfurtransferase
MERWISCSDVLMRLGDDEVVVVDCRPELEWQLYQLQIPGALRMPFEELLHSAGALPDDELIVLCGSDDADDGEVQKAWRVLRKHGRHAVCLEGGLSHWIARGFPTERSKSRRPSSHHERPEADARL